MPSPVATTAISIPNDGTAAVVTPRCSAEAAPVSVAYQADLFDIRRDAVAGAKGIADAEPAVKATPPSAASAIIDNLMFIAVSIS